MRSSEWSGLGARVMADGGVLFRVWAPLADRVEVVFPDGEGRVEELVAEGRGHFSLRVGGVGVGSDYVYRLDGEREFPDPASAWQPRGVHGPSRVVDHGHDWGDGLWRGLALRDAVIYELHVGTFTEEGTLDAAAGQLAVLRELGVTVIELMPLAQFPGGRNWGYDGVYPYAVQDSYGGPAALRRFVDRAHGLGLAVILDVVYNHLGPEGNYLGQYGPYFTDRYRTPWGAALNFDGADSDGVRRYFLENALMWQRDYHLDGLRLDAVHAIRDFSAYPFLEELGVETRRMAEGLGRPFHLIAESDLNMSRHITSRELGGYGLDAQWSDDFHHALHVLLTGERGGYYSDYEGLGELVRAWREGYAYTGQYSVHRRHRHGSSPRHNGVKQFVVCMQNHDQVGNRMLGDRLSASLSFDRLRCGAMATLLSPMIPLLFMGEEYGERRPFQYFVSHGDEGLVEAVRRGRREEFASFAWVGEVPDPQDEETFYRCKLGRELMGEPGHGGLHAFYRECLRLRRELRGLALVEKETQEVTGWEAEGVLVARSWAGGGEVVVLIHFGETARDFRLPVMGGGWRVLLDSGSEEWGGGGDSLQGALLESDGGLALGLRPWSGLVLERVREDEA